MTAGAALFIAFLLVQRLGELALSWRNTRRLLDRGAREAGAAHYPLIVALHGAWLLCLVIFGHDEHLRWGWLAVFGLLQVGRIWIIASLGGRWTTRIIVLEEPLVTRGPFRFVRHPNYLLVAAEVFVGSMVLGLLWVALVFSALNAAVLTLRIRVEDAALASAMAKDGDHRERLR